MKKRLAILVSIFLFSILVPSILALNTGVCVTAEVSDISPSSIGVNKEFTVGIQIENCGDKIPGPVSFELLNPPTDILIKEPLILNISKLYYANSERFITYHMKTSEDIISGTYIIKTRLSYEDRIKNGEISIDVIGDKAELSIASIKTDPVLPYKEDIVELTLRIENFGDGTANAVKVYTEHPFNGVKESFIGTLLNDEDGPAIFTFIADKYGEFEIPVKINYKDDFGDQEIQSQINITILKKEINWGLIIFVIVLIGFSVWAVNHYAKLKRTKNKIIHQLLQGENIHKKSLEEHPKKHIRKSQEEKKKKEKRIKEFKKEVLKKYKK